MNSIQLPAAAAPIQTAFLGKIGADILGDFVLAGLAREHVDFLGARDGQTGVSFVLNSIRDDRTILIYKGINSFLEQQDIPALDTHWVYLSSMIGKSWQTVVDFLGGSELKLAFNPSSYQTKMGYEALRILTDKVALLVMNREEAHMFLGLDYREQTDMKALVTALCKVPGQITVITDGANGAWVFDGAQVLVGKPMPTLKIVETTGAGDAFAATFTACHMRNMDLPGTLHYAMTNAESVLQYKGAKEKLLTWDALEVTAAQNKREIQTFTR
jgi:ribokinase